MAGNVCCTWRMRLNDQVNWREVFGEFIARPSLADPGNKERHVFMLTLLFTEAGMRELDDQITGRIELPRTGVGWERITRNAILDRAERLRPTLPDDQRIDEPATEGRFKDRWPLKGGMANFFMCMVLYACTEPKWRRVHDQAPQRTLAALPRVRSGELSLAEVIDDVGRRSLTMSVRLARCWLFPLMLTMDTHWKGVGHAAYRELLDNYTARWVPVYEKAIDELGVALRPDMDPVRLSKEVAAQIHGAAADLAGKGEVEEGDMERFVHAVQALIYASLDTGDGKDMPAAFTERLRRSREWHAEADAG